MRQSLSKAQDILVEWQRETTLTQILGHFLSIVSEMLTLVLCIFFLKQWLAFDLFRGPALSSGAGGPEAHGFHFALKWRVSDHKRWRA